MEDEKRIRIVILASDKELPPMSSSQLDDFQKKGGIIFAISNPKGVLTEEITKRIEEALKSPTSFPAGYTFPEVL